MRLKPLAADSGCCYRIDITAIYTPPAGAIGGTGTAAMSGPPFKTGSCTGTSNSSYVINGSYIGQTVQNDTRYVCDSTTLSFTGTSFFSNGMNGTYVFSWTITLEDSNGCP